MLDDKEIVVYISKSGSIYYIYFYNKDEKGISKQLHSRAPVVIKKLDQTIEGNKKILEEGKIKCQIVRSQEQEKFGNAQKKLFENFGKQKQELFRINYDDKFEEKKIDKNSKKSRKSPTKKSTQPKKRKKEKKNVEIEENTEIDLNSSSKHNSVEPDFSNEHLLRFKKLLSSPFTFSQPNTSNFNPISPISPTFVGNYYQQPMQPQYQPPMYPFCMPQAQYYQPQLVNPLIQNPEMQQSFQTLQIVVAQQQQILELLLKQQENKKESK